MREDYYSFCDVEVQMNDYMYVVSGRLFYKYYSENDSTYVDECTDVEISDIEKLDRDGTEVEVTDEEEKKISEELRYNYENYMEIQIED